MSQPLLFGVAGRPVTHSLSPRIHAFWYEQLGLNAVYTALDLSDACPEADLRALARAGYMGLNVTLPHKLEAVRASDRLSAAAEAIGAVNTLIRYEDGAGHRKWQGENTDWTGFLWSLDQVLPAIPKHAVLIGAGGAARAVAYGLNTRGISLTLVNRTVSKAEDMASELKLSVSRVTHIDDLAGEAGTADLVINTISLGHSGGQLDLPETGKGWLVDISYGAAARPTLSAAEAKGWQTQDGLPMLIGQAADAFRMWFGLDADRTSALKAVRSWL
jgi:shikimate dehydrogenase